jgi:hypothetical protein
MLYEILGARTARAASAIELGSEDVREKRYDPEDDRISDRHGERFVIDHRWHCRCSMGGSRPTQDQLALRG